MQHHFHYSACTSPPLRSSRLACSFYQTNFHGDLAFIPSLKLLGNLSSFISVFIDCYEPAFGTETNETVVEKVLLNDAARGTLVSSLTQQNKVISSCFLFISRSTSGLSHDFL